MSSHNFLWTNNWSCWIGWNLYTVLSFLWVFSCKFTICYKLHRFGIKKEILKLGFLIVSLNCWMISFSLPEVVKIMSENLPNFLREIPEWLTELEGPSIKRASHKLSKVPKGKRKAMQCFAREGSALRVLAVILVNLNCSHWINHTETFHCGWQQKKGLRTACRGSLLRGLSSFSGAVPSLNIWENKMVYLWTPIAGTVPPLTSTWSFLQTKWKTAHPETKESKAEHAA